MRFRSLDELIAEGVLRRTRPDRHLVDTLLARAVRDLKLATELVTTDTERAAMIAYEAGLEACLGILQLEGLRVTSEPGHHRATLEAAATLLGREFGALLRELDEARDLRNASLYGEPAPVTAGAVEAIIASSSRLADTLRERGRKTAIDVTRMCQSSGTSASSSRPTARIPHACRRGRIAGWARRAACAVLRLLPTRRRARAVSNPGRSRDGRPA